MSYSINMEALKAYRIEVGRKTRKIVSSLAYADLKTKVLSDGLKDIMLKGAVSKNENASWLIDFWRNKTVLGILLMPATRHLFVHNNESMEAKQNGLKLRG